MKIHAERRIFRVPIEIEENLYLTGGKAEAVPTDNVLDVNTNEDNSNIFAVTTHDRGNQKRGPYYQVAFYVEKEEVDPTGEISLKLTFTDRKDKDQSITLFNNKGVRTEEGGIWYEKVVWKYKKIRNDGTKKDPEPDKEVSSIFASGVFTVSGYIGEKCITSISITVKPSTVKLVDYQLMLDDLSRLHSSLVINSKSTVGVGKEVNDIEHWMCELQRLIIKLKTNSNSKKLKRVYEKIDINKIRKFDSKVLKSYITRGYTQKIDGIKYIESHDIYENQVIKKALSSIVSSFDRVFLQEYENILIEKETNNRIYQRLKEDDSTRKKVSGTRNPPNYEINKESLDLFPHTNSYYQLIIQFIHKDNKYTITTKDKEYKDKTGCRRTIRTQCPFRRNGFNCDVTYITESNGKALRFLYWLSELYTKIEDKKQETVEFSWDKSKCNENSISEHHIQSRYFSVIEEGKVREFCNELLSDDEYYEKLDQILSMNSKYSDYIQIQDEGYQKWGERVEAKAKLRNNRLKEKNAERLIKVRNELYSLLEDEWFESVSEISSLQYDYVSKVHTIKPTMRFIRDKDYSKVYTLLDEFYSKYYVLEGKFDANAFPIKKTEVIYEYWVLFKLVDCFARIGFKYEGKNIEKIWDSVLCFIESNKTPEGYTIALSKDEISLELGFNCKIGDYTPDYYIRVNPGTESEHWYFIDAKYKCFSDFSKNRDGTFDWNEEICMVSIEKYFYNMRKKSINVKGSYIISAYIEEEDDKTLSEGNLRYKEYKDNLSYHDRLFGNESMIKKELPFLDSKIRKDEKTYKEIIRQVEENGRPKHRYGIIQLVPTNDSELHALIKMIMEYHEGKYKEYCWECGHKKCIRRPLMTQGGFLKYHIVCNNRDCSNFRQYKVETHCYIGTCRGNTLIKYKNRNYNARAKEGGRRNWNFYCPECGKLASSSNTDDQSFTWGGIDYPE